MKPLFAFCCLLFSSITWAEMPHEAPELTSDMATELFAQALSTKPLYWMPFPFPYDVDRSGVPTKDSRLLDALFRHGLIERDSGFRVVDVEGSHYKRRVEAIWTYRYPSVRTGKNAGRDEGFYYGYGRLIKILEVSAPQWVIDAYYAEVRYQWVVEDVQDWVKDPAFKQARTLRRAVESQTRPFETLGYVQFDGTQWQVWKSPFDVQ